MDTSPYSNILNAVQGTADGKNGKLTLQQEADNYNTFSRLMKEGVYLPDMVKRIDELETKVKGIEEAPKNKMNEELFAVMESVVRSDPEVRTARQKLADVKTEILTEMCLKDPRYREVYDDYRTTVNRQYIHQKEQSEKGD